METHHRDQAEKYERQGDYLGARMAYLQNVEVCKQSKDERAWTEAKELYTAFARRDPVFKQLIDWLIPVIRANYGILQSELVTKAPVSTWADIYKKDRPVMRDDISYALYFGSQFGLIIRTKKGRSYALTLPPKEVQAP